MHKNLIFRLVLLFVFALPLKAEETLDYICEGQLEYFTLINSNTVSEDKPAIVSIKVSTERIEFLEKNKSPKNFVVLQQGGLDGNLDLTGVFGRDNFAVSALSFNERSKRLTVASLFQGDGIISVWECSRF